MNKNVFKNAQIVTMNPHKEVIKNGYIVVEGTNIVKVGHDIELLDEEYKNVYDLQGSIMIPGLVNAHSHSYSNIVKGTTENLPLEIWMLYVMAEGKEMSKEDVYISSLLGSIEMLKGGTTSFLDHLAQPMIPLLQTAKAYKEIGIRAWVTPMFTDKPYYETLPYMDTERVDQEISKEHLSVYENMLGDLFHELNGYDSRVKFGIGPSGPHRCSDDLLLLSYELAERFNVPWHTHVLESKAQLVKATQLYQKEVIKHLDDLGILSSRCSLAHAVWITEDEMKILADKKASVVHNPISNLMLGSGILPLIQMREAGVNVALGTDGANCCGFQSMFEVMKLAAILSNTNTADFSRWLQGIDILEMATNHSSHALGVGDQIGSIDVGKQADFVILNPKNTGFVPLNNLIWQLVYGRADLSVSQVYVAGKLVVDDGKLVTMNEFDIYREAMERGESLLKRLEIDYKNIETDHHKLKDMILKL